VVALPSEPAKARRTPFMPPDGICGGGAGEGGGEGNGTGVTGGGKGRDGRRVPKREAPRPLRDPVLDLEYVGLATACGQTRGLLRDAKGALLRVQVGEVLDRLGCTVVAIGDQSIVLRTKTGRIYELRNSRCP
jgi:hypothetical protein